MSEIPEDIWKKAEAAFYAAWDVGHPEFVAQALLAERQRCADVAAACPLVVALAPGTACGASSASKQISAAIMEPVK